MTVLNDGDLASPLLACILLADMVSIIQKQKCSVTYYLGFPTFKWLIPNVIPQSVSDRPPTPRDASCEPSIVFKTRSFHQAPSKKAQDPFPHTDPQPPPTNIDQTLRSRQFVPPHYSPTSLCLPTAASSLNSDQKSCDHMLSTKRPHSSNSSSSHRPKTLPSLSLSLSLPPPTPADGPTPLRTLALSAGSGFSSSFGSTGVRLFWGIVGWFCELVEGFWVVWEVVVCWARRRSV